MVGRAGARRPQQRDGAGQERDGAPRNRWRRSRPWSSGGWGEPLQYVLGIWAFRTLELAVDPRVLIPRPETEVVVGHALDEIGRFVAESDSTDR